MSTAERIQEEAELKKRLTEFAQGMINVDVLVKELSDIKERLKALDGGHG